MTYPTLRSARAALDWVIAQASGRADVGRMMRDPSAPPLVAAAARLVWTAGSDARRYSYTRDGQRVLAGLDPEVGRAWDRVADRLDGRPMQSLAVHRTSDRSPAESLAALGALLERHPSLAAALAPRLATIAPMATARTDPPVPARTTPAPPKRDANVGGEPPPMFQPIPGSFEVIDPSDDDSGRSAVLSSVEGAVGATEDGSVASDCVGPAPMESWSSDGPGGVVADQAEPERELTPRQRVLARRKAERARRAPKGTEF